MADKRRRILVADDDEAVLDFMIQVLSEVHDVIPCRSGTHALEYLQSSEPLPDLVVLDVRMPGLDGYQVCSRMQEREDLAWIPVIFVTALDQQSNQQQALAAGAAAYLQKPFGQDELLQAVAGQLDTSERWSSLRDRGSARPTNWLLPSTFVAFKRYLMEQRDATPAQATAAEQLGPDDTYVLAGILRLSEEQLARYLARFLGLPYREEINVDEISLTKLPRKFSTTNHVAVLMDGTVVMANPFDWELTDLLERTVWRQREPVIHITAPGRIRRLWSIEQGERHVRPEDVERVIQIDERGPMKGVQGFEMQWLLNEILRDAIAADASDVHLDRTPRAVLVMYRLNGILHEMRKLSGPEGTRLNSRLKAVAGLDIAQVKRPQSGSLAVQYSGREFKAHLLVTPGPHGENVALRLFEPDQKPSSLAELGFSGRQQAKLRNLVERPDGFLLIVGPPRSGKSTTIFSLLSSLDGEERSIMTVEDPIEYLVPAAKQQEVDLRTRTDFDTLLRAALEEEPDVLFINELRDPFSARSAVAHAGSGHITISSIRSSNSTTALFRLERLGIAPADIADTVSAIVAQKLIRVLCNTCRIVRDISDEEKTILSAFTDDVPARVARPAGCPDCRDTGYVGQDVVAEILPFDRAIADRVREGKSIGEIREFFAGRGDPLFAHHAIEKIRSLKFSVRDVYERILVEEEALGTAESESRHPGVTAAAAQIDPDLPAELHAPAGSPRVLVVDDDIDVRTLLELYMTNAGYEVVTAADGIDALLEIGRGEFEAVLSDVNMPNLDGEKLMEMIGQKGVRIPVLFLTGVEEEHLEERLLALGAIDCIQKPVRKEILLRRIRKAVEMGQSHEEEGL